MAARAGVITVSDSAAAGERDDRSGPAVAARLEESDFDVEPPVVVADDRAAIVDAIRAAAARGCQLVMTTGGTGVGPRDVTPEATRSILDLEVPGLAEHMRRVGSAATPTAILSRGLAGFLGSTLVINLPGSERGAVESLDAVLPVLGHALDLVAGKTAHPG